MAAVQVPAGLFGAHGSFAVSPQHRLRLAGWTVERHLGTADVLVKARHLVRLGLLSQDQTGSPVIYHHLLFDRHQIILSAGLWSESYHPGPETLQDRRIRAEVLGLFPALGQDPEYGYGPLVRAECSLHEAAVLMS
jgi:hypothetical protein